MITTIPDVEKREWYLELDELRDPIEEEERCTEAESKALLHGEGDAVPDDEIDRAAEDLEAASESA